MFLFMHNQWFSNKTKAGFGEIESKLVGAICLQATAELIFIKWATQINQ